MLSRGQVSSELLVGVIIILALFILILVNNSLMDNSSQAIAGSIQNKTTCIKLAQLLSSIYANGSGSQAALEMDSSFSIQSSTKTIFVGYEECYFLAKTIDYDLDKGKVLIKNVDGTVTVNLE